MESKIQNTITENIENVKETMVSMFEKYQWMKIYYRYEVSASYKPNIVDVQIWSVDNSYITDVVLTNMQESGFEFIAFSIKGMNACFSKVF